MRGPNYFEFLLLFGLLPCAATTIYFAFNLSNSEVMRCTEEERQALLKFKLGLCEDDYGRLSWDMIKNKNLYIKYIKSGARRERVKYIIRYMILRLNHAVKTPRGGGISP